MTRRFEWLFPIHMYIRLRKEVVGLHVFLAVLSAVLAPAAVFIALSFSDFIPYNWPTPVEISLAVGAVLAVIGSVELVVALIFVRKRPGRRRPLCTWRTFKYILLGGQTWMFFALPVAGSVCLGEWLRSVAPSWWKSLAVVTDVAATVLLTTLLVVSGATAVQAAQAVIALQDDRRCEECGYFLIGLTTPRCPECGQPFDPSKLSKLAVGSGETDRDAS